MRVIAADRRNVDPGLGPGPVPTGLAAPSGDEGPGCGAEAYSDSGGVDKNERDYRYDSDYVAVQREDWTPDCYPNCAFGSTELTVTLP